MVLCDLYMLNEQLASSKDKPVKGPQWLLVLLEGIWTRHRDWLGILVLYAQFLKWTCNEKEFKTA